MFSLTKRGIHPGPGPLQTGAGYGLTDRGSESGGFPSLRTGQALSQGAHGLDRWPVDGFGKRRKGNLKESLVPYPADQMRTWEISPWLISPENDDPSLWKTLLRTLAHLTKQIRRKSRSRQYQATGSPKGTPPRRYKFCHKTPFFSC